MLKLNKFAIATILIGGLFAGCTSDYENSQAQNTEAIEVEDVVEDTEEFMGQVVTVRGEVEEILGPNAFFLEGEEILGNDESVLVIDSKITPQLLTEGEDIQVKGKVSQFTMAEFERDYDLNWDLEIKKKIEAEYENRPVIVAEFIELSN